MERPKILPHEEHKSLSERGSGSLQPAGSADSSPNAALRLARIVLQSTLYSECQEARELTDLLLASGGQSANWNQEWRSPPNAPGEPPAREQE